MIHSDSHDAFAAAWRRTFPLAPPVGYRMCEVYPTRWFRIHSLPESKRYPENESEYAELLARHNAVATDLFGEGCSVVLVLQEYLLPREDKRRAPTELPMTLPGEPRLLRRVDPRELHPQADLALDMPVDLWALPVIWRAGGLDAMIRSVADDRGPMFVLSTPDAERVYAPYDGGADLYLENRDERDAWKSRYSAWLSAHPAGL